MFKFRVTRNGALYITIFLFHLESFPLRDDLRLFRPYGWFSLAWGDFTLLDLY
ncbi:hypothetical protein NSTC731_00029 [Nostoc sp. DSM 114167]|jgi:hypothetical protein